MYTSARPELCFACRFGTCNCVQTAVSNRQRDGLCSHKFGIFAFSNRNLASLAGAWVIMISDPVACHTSAKLVWIQCESTGLDVLIFLHSSTLGVVVISVRDESSKAARVA